MSGSDFNLWNQNEGGSSDLNGQRRTTISRSMSAVEIIKTLVERQCPDITPQLNLDQCTTVAVSYGGFGDIFKGTMRYEIEVAIKCPRIHIQQSDVIGHKALKDAARELYIWSRLKHRNVLELFGLAMYQDRMAMISPWMANGTLLQHINQNSKVNRYQLLVQITRGVAYLHENDVIHGDLKGGNVLVSYEGVPKIADFGSTTLKKSQSLYFTSTINPAISARWAAPEVLTAQAPPSKAADVYSLGMIFLEVITGRLPFDDISSDLQVMFAVHSGRIPDQPKEFTLFNKVQAELLWELCEYTWKPDPSKRPNLEDIQRSLREMKIRSREQPGDGFDHHQWETSQSLLEKIVQVLWNLFRDDYFSSRAFGFLLFSVISFVGLICGLLWY